MATFQSLEMLTTGVCIDWPFGLKRSRSGAIFVIYTKSGTVCLTISTCQQQRTLIKTPFGWGYRLLVIHLMNQLHLLERQRGSQILEFTFWPKEMPISRSTQATHNRAIRQNIVTTTWVASSWRSPDDTFIVDPGMPTYTADYVQKKRIPLDGVSQHGTDSMVSNNAQSMRRDLFSFPVQNDHTTVRFEPGESFDRCECDFTNQNSGITHRRVIGFDRDIPHWTIEDFLADEGENEHEVGNILSRSWERWKVSNRETGGLFISHPNRSSFALAAMENQLYHIPHRIIRRATACWNQQRF